MELFEARYSYIVVLFASPRRLVPCLVQSSDPPPASPLECDPQEDYLIAEHHPNRLVLATILIGVDLAT